MQRQRVSKSAAWTLAAAMALTGVVAAGLATPAAAFHEGGECPHSHGYFKHNNKHEWPVDELVLGDETYFEDSGDPTLVELLKKPPKGDASLELAKQLIAAKLNLVDDPAPAPEVVDAVADADDLLDDFSGFLPYDVDETHPDWQAFQDLRETLDEYNNGGWTEACTDTLVEKDGHATVVEGNTNHVHFVITVTALGPGWSANVVLEDTVPAGTWAVSGCGDVTEFTSDGTDVLMCDLGDIEEGGSVVVQISRDVEPEDCGTTIGNEATASASADGDEGNNTGADSIDVVCDV